MKLHLLTSYSGRCYTAHVVDLLQVLGTAMPQIREQTEDFIFTDDNYDEPVWEHEHRIRAKPMTRKQQNNGHYQYSDWP